MYAVLTGDIVDSNTASASLIAEALHDTYQRVQAVYENALPYPLSVFRGDSWQMVIPDPAHALSVSVLFRAALRTELQRDTRIACAIDTVDALDSDHITESTGAAFTRSGTALDALEAPYRMQWRLPKAALPPVQIAAAALADLADHIIIHWTDAQAQAVSLRLSTWLRNGDTSQRALAEQWHPAPITQQAFSKHLQHAHWPRVRDALHQYRTLAPHLSSLSISNA